jgi:hypothetical protein
MREVEVEAIFAAAFRRLKPRTELPAIGVQFRPFANLNSTIRLRDGCLVVRLSDLLQGSPPSVIEALAAILLAKLYRKPVPPRAQLRFRQFANRRDVSRQLHLVRQERGRKQIEGPVGQHYHLDQLFQELNRQFFGGMLAMPLLTWSRTRSTVKLGHFDPSHNVIVISRYFDSPRVPRFLLEYLMFHEMLHLKHPIRVAAGNGRRCIHSELFQQDERRFPRYEEARKALNRLGTLDA